jgi:excisionase family DNA binding protein
MEEDELLTIKEVAKALKVSEGHVYRLLKQGEISAIKRGRRFTRVQESDLTAFLQRYRKEAIPSKEVEG